MERCSKERMKQKKYVTRRLLPFYSTSFEGIVTLVELHKKLFPRNRREVIEGYKQRDFHTVWLSMNYTEYTEYMQKLSEVRA